MNTKTDNQEKKITQGEKYARFFLNMVYNYLLKKEWHMYMNNLHLQVGRNVRKVHLAVWQVPVPNIVRIELWIRQCQRRECWLVHVYVCRFYEIVPTPVTWCPVSFQAPRVEAKKESDAWDFFSEFCIHTGKYKYFRADKFISLWPYRHGNYHCTYPLWNLQIYWPLGLTYWFWFWTLQFVVILGSEVVITLDVNLY